MTIVVFGKSSKKVATITDALTLLFLSRPVESFRQELTGTCGIAKALTKMSTATGRAFTLVNPSGRDAEMTERFGRDWAGTTMPRGRRECLAAGRDGDFETQRDARSCYPTRR